MVGFGLGAQILALAAGGSVCIAPLAFRVEQVRRVVDDALAGYLPAAYVNVVYMRDRCEPPPTARVLAADSSEPPYARNRPPPRTALSVSWLWKNT